MGIEHELEDEFSTLRESVSLGREDFHAAVLAAKTKIQTGIANLITQIPLPEKQAKRIILRIVQEGLSNGIW